MAEISIVEMPDGICIMKGSAYKTLDLANQYATHDYPNLMVGSRIAFNDEASFWTNQISKGNVVVISEPPPLKVLHSFVDEKLTRIPPEIGDRLNQAGIHNLIDSHRYHFNRIGNNRKGEMIITFSEEIGKPTLMTFLLVETNPTAIYQRVY